MLPELFATGYNIGDQIAARPELADWPTALTIATLAKAHNIAIHYGFAETDGNNTFNAAVAFSNAIALFCERHWREVHCITCKTRLY